MNGWRLYWRYVGVSLRAQMQYKASFLLAASGQFIVTGVEIFGVWALFARFGELKHWGLAEVCLFYGLVNMAFAIADALSSGFDVFGSEYVKTGNFDRLLLRPRSVVLQILGHELALRRIGRFLQGAIVFGWAMSALQIDWSAATVALLLFAIAGAVCLFHALIILQATLSFWTVESLEVMNTMTYGGVEVAQYPLDIYSAWLRKFFTYVVPLACVSYFPVVGRLGIDGPLGAGYLCGLASPAAGVLWLALA
jgi:ABC-2 type transport system permease protein